MPQRILLPGIRDSATLDKCTPEQEALYYRLLVSVDDFGRFDARPAIVRGTCLPLKDYTLSQVGDMLFGLQSHGLIVLYKTPTGEYLQMRKWRNDPRAKESKFPGPPDDFDGIKADSDKCLQMFADAPAVQANSPVTVTVTDTDTDTDTDTAQAPKARQARKSVDWESVLEAKGVEPQTARDWLQVRKAKRLPLTETGLTGIEREAEKARLTLDSALKISVRRGWASFDADWLRNNNGDINGSQHKNKQQMLEESNRKIAKNWIPPELRGQHETN